MQHSARKRILISEPQAFRQRSYYPYMWAILKSYCERKTDLAPWTQWLPPIYQKDDPETLVQPFRDSPPDVLGLSCYTWNWELQCRIARLIKLRYPRCIVVAGGPHPDYKDPDFFGKYPFIDMVAVRDGEITFSRILAKLIREELSFQDVPGLYLAGTNGGGHIHTGPTEVPVEFDHSPYLDQSAYFEKLKASSGSISFDVIWETNRGCPYSCNFCDWGSNTMSKVRKFDMERVKAEIDWFAHMKVNAIMLTDANFGILPRDLEIADILNEARSKGGHPKFVHYSPAKNNPDRTVELARKFVASGISPVHPFAIQHTNVGVLAAADRANISADKQRQIAKAVVTEHIPTLVQLIIGIPGDTYDLWKTCLTDLMDWGLHDNYQIFNYTLLPNAPAAEKSFRAEWQIETITRDIPQEGTGQRPKDDTDALTRVDIIVRSKSYSRQDWVKMKIYAAFIRALHNRSLTRLIAMYLHFTHGVSYRDFYDRIIEDYFGKSSLYQALTEHFVRFLNNESAFEDLEFDRLGSPLYVEPSQWLFLQICCDFDTRFEELEAFLVKCFPQAGNLAGAVHYQRNVIVAPSIGQKQDRSFNTDFDWIRYFEKAATLTQYEPLAEPAATPGAVVEVLDDISEFVGARKDPRLAWIELVREVRRTLTTNFQRLRLRTSTSQL